MLVIYSLVKLCNVYITHAEEGRCYPGYYSPIVPRQYKKSYLVHMIEIAWLPLGSTLGDDDPMSNTHSPFFTLLLFFASSPLTLTAAIICCLVLVNVRGTLRQLQDRAAKLVFSIGLQVLFNWLSDLIQQLWLPVKLYILFKLLQNVSKSQQGVAPSYMAELLSMNRIGTELVLHLTNPALTICTNKNKEHHFQLHAQRNEQNSSTHHFLPSFCLVLIFSFCL